MQLLQSQSDLAGNSKFYSGDEKVLENSVRKWSIVTILIVQGTRHRALQREQGLCSHTVNCQSWNLKYQFSNYSKVWSQKKKHKWKCSFMSFLSSSDFVCSHRTILWHGSKNSLSFHCEWCKVTAASSVKDFSAMSILPYRQSCLHSKLFSNLLSWKHTF